MRITSAPRKQAPTPDPNGRQLMRAYQRDVAMLPGIVRIRWTLEQPDAVELFYEDPQLMALSQGVLRDTLMGARWVFTLEDGASALPAPPANGRPPWYERAQNIASAASAIPGIDDINYDRAAGTVTLFTHDADAAAHLRPLLRDRFGDIAVRVVARP